MPRSLSLVREGEESAQPEGKVLSGTDQSDQTGDSPEDLDPVLMEGEPDDEDQDDEDTGEEDQDDDSDDSDDSDEDNGEDQHEDSEGNEASEEEGSGIPGLPRIPRAAASSAPAPAVNLHNPDAIMARVELASPDVQKVTMLLGIQLDRYKHELETAHQRIDGLDDTLWYAIHAFAAAHDVDFAQLGFEPGTRAEQVDVEALFEAIQAIAAGVPVVEEEEPQEEEVPATLVGEMECLLCLGDWVKSTAHLNQQIRASIPKVCPACNGTHRSTVLARG